MQQMIKYLLAEMEASLEKMESMINTIQEQMTAKIKTNQE
jgi:hypothetical protein